MENSKIARLFLFGVVLGTLFGCNYTHPKGDGFRNSDNPVQNDPSAPTVETNYAMIARDLLEPQCVDCHSGPNAKGDLDLSTYAGVLSSIVPGDPEESLLYLMVDWDEMPPGGGVSRGMKQTLKEWIEKGAKQ